VVPEIETLNVGVIIPGLTAKVTPALFDVAVISDASGAVADVNDVQAR
jgi:hypothetical protein